MINDFCDPSKFEAISKDMREYFKNKRQQSKDWVLSLTEKRDDMKNDFTGLCIFVKEYQKFGIVTSQDSDDLWNIQIDSKLNIYYDEVEVLFGLGL